MEQIISKDVQQRLDKINWDDLKNKYGILREAVEKNHNIASQLAYGQMTDLIRGNTSELSGMFSLRAYPQEGQEFWAVKAYTMEKAKTQNDTLFLYNQPITSQRIKEALLERTSWEDGEKNIRHGFANANAGRPIAIELDGKKQEFLVSIHQPTNRVVGMPVEQVKNYLFDKDGNSRGRGIYGVTFTDEQAKVLSDGGAVVINGQRKDGEKFTCCVQFDAAQRTIVPCHPQWLKEAEKAGMNMNVSPVQQERKQEEKKVKEVKEVAKSQEQKKTASKGMHR